MGYYTSHNMIVKNVKESEFESLKNALRECDLIGYVFDSGSYNKHIEKAFFYEYDVQKWYDQEADMQEISKKFPKMVFEISCVGEDYDQWKNYYQNGKSEFCAGHLTFDKPSTINW